MFVAFYNITWCSHKIRTNTYMSHLWSKPACLNNIKPKYFSKPVNIHNLSIYTPWSSMNTNWQVQIKNEVTMTINFLSLHPFLSIQNNQNFWNKPTLWNFFNKRKATLLKTTSVPTPELVSFIWDDDGTGPDHGFPNPTLRGNYSAPNLPCPIPDQQDPPRAKGT